MDSHLRVHFAGETDIEDGEEGRPMTKTSAAAADILEVSAWGYAAAALAELEARAPQIAAADSSLGAERRAWFVQRVLELAAALRASEPALFTSRVDWLRQALWARGADESDLQWALRALDAALEAELPEPLRKAARAPVRQAIGRLAEAAVPAAAGLDAATRNGHLAAAYLEACLDGDPDRGMAAVLRALGQGALSAAEAYVHVLAPAEREIGRLWHIGEISVAEERIVSETTRRLMAVIADRFLPLESTGRKVLAAAVASNAHDIGVRVVADLFRLAGWRALFLGGSVPAAEIGRGVELFDVDLVAIGVTLTTQLGEAAKAIAAVKRAHPEVKVLVGGAAFDEVPELWRQLDADGYAATVDAAVEVGASLVREAR